MIKYLKALFGNDGVTRDLFDKDNGHLQKFGEFLGNTTFTKEEMAEFDEEAAKGIRQFAIATMGENTDRSRARRKLAIFILQAYVLFLFIGAMVYPIDKDWSKVWFSITINSELGWLALGVGGFFWGTHMLRSSKFSGEKGGEGE